MVNIKNNIMNLGQGIKEIRKKSGMNQDVFSKKINITQSYLSQIEKSRKFPNTDVLLRISKLTNTPLPILFWFTIEKEDVSENKKESYDQLKPTIDNLIKTIFF